MKKLNNKGFTLVELLAVIIILAVVVGISIPAVMSTVSNAKEKAFETAADTCADWIERQYQLYAVDPNQVTDANVKAMFAGTHAKTLEGIVLACGLKAENADATGSTWTINNDRICLKLKAKTGGDYDNLSSPTKNGGAC